jgi:uncharacterized membrane protein
MEKKYELNYLQLKSYVRSRHAVWFWAVVAIVTVTMISISIPDGHYPANYVRVVLTLSFILGLPGFVLLKLLFPLERNIKPLLQTSSLLNRLFLSVVLSMIISPSVGLILHFSPWGLELVPLLLSLACLTIVFATIGLLRSFLLEPSSSLS